MYVAATLGLVITFWTPASCINEMDCRLTHTPAATAWAETAALTAERHEMLVKAALALHTQESVGENSTLEILPELLNHEVWERVTGLLLFQVKGE